MYNKKLDEFAFELLKYLYKTFDYDGERLSKDVYIYIAIIISILLTNKNAKRKLKDYQYVLKKILKLKIT